jgi:CRISPR-associated protein Cmr6
MSNYYIPQETERLLTPTRIAQCKNAGLLLDKYPTQEAIEDNEKKGIWLKAFAQANHIDTQLIASVAGRWQNMLQAMTASAFTAPTSWRMVVGLGGNSVLETDLTLHHMYGIPFIPGSALKGLTRAYATGEVEKSKKLEDDGPEVKRIFGTQDRSGSVIFFDAMPVDEHIELKLDIMNAHYPKYYSEHQIPSNTQNPNPVTFLTVAATTFIFAVAPLRPTREKDRDDTKKAYEWLQAAIKNYGVGGKTSAGYGRFQEFSDLSFDQIASQNGSTAAPTAYVDPEVAKATRLMQELETMRTSDVANRINSYYQEWSRLTFADAKKLLAEAIIDKVKKAGREKQSSEKAWYKELVAFLGQV